MLPSSSPLSALSEDPCCFSCSASFCPPPHLLSISRYSLLSPSDSTNSWTPSLSALPTTASIPSSPLNPSLNSPYSTVHWTYPSPPRNSSRNNSLGTLAFYYWPGHPLSKPIFHFHSMKIEDLSSSSACFTLLAFPFCLDSWIPPSGHWSLNSLLGIFQANSMTGSEKKSLCC